MPSSRRTFLKTSLIASAGAALPSIPALASTSGTAPALQLAGTPFTRGIGVYPGAPEDFFGPTFVIDSTTYRNLALHRPATHSSAYDYNLTAQLVTDGIVDTTPPRWISAFTSTAGVLPKTTREVLIDHWEANTTLLAGGIVTAYLELGGGADVPEIDAVGVFVAVSNSISPNKLSFTISVSDDGRAWQPTGSITGPQPIVTNDTTYPPDLIHGSHLYHPTIALKGSQRKRFYQLELAVSGNPADNLYTSWKLGQMVFYHASQRVQIGGPYSFTSAWMSAGLGEEWVAIDLGAPCTFDRVTLHWIARAAEGAIQTSNDGQTWTLLKPLPSTLEQVDDIHLATPAHARHVRVLMTRPTSPDGYILSEFEIFGRGGPVPRPAPATPPAEGRLNLAGSAWRLQRDSEVDAPGTVVSQRGFKDAKWLPATVPGTVLTSYLNAGAIPDPNFGQNQLYISDSFFYSDFWYRTTFTPPPARPGELQWLNFAGINWKALVFLNGEQIGRIDGGFTRARFNVTGKLQLSAENALAIRVLKNDTPGSCKQKTYEAPGVNGGALGADNPTFHASIGWDWIPTIRGRNAGIWGDVWVETTGTVTVENPLVSSTIGAGNSSATLTIQAELVNHGSQPISGRLHGKFGDLPFGHAVTVAPDSSRTVSIDPLPIENPKLWWPVGYGEPHLYTVELSFESSAHETHDRRSFKAGIRQMTFTEESRNLKLFINGRRFIPRGGNWGFGESMLRYRAREYDAAVRYHREMNFTMIRNWVGQIPDDAFYEACDRHGVVVWQDFWLANPWDGPIPNDNALFLANARDLILRIRNHASIGLYVGRNEGFPPPPLEAGIRALLAELHPGIHYIGSSADDVVSGHGPYRALPPTFYFQHADTKFHSEIGMPNIPTIESVRAMMPANAVWPQGLEWGLHDFCLNGAQGGQSFLDTIANDYGGAHTAEEWITLAQFVNYEGYRAIFEAGSKDRMGVLLWMSHPCWPSFVWQTYDFYLEPTAAYFGCKKASEPLHIQWNRYSGFVEVVNLSAGNQTGLTASVEILNLDGRSKSTQNSALSIAEDSVVPSIQISYPAELTPVHFLRLTLSRDGSLVSSNFYLRGIEEGNLRAIRELDKVKLSATTTVVRKEGIWLLTTELKNSTPTPALMVRLKAIRETTGDRILPVIYSDNYVTLLPGESRTITTEVNHTDTRGQRPRIVLSGFNIAT